MPRFFSAVLLSLCLTGFPLFGASPSLLPTSLPLPADGRIPKFVSVALLIEVPQVSVATDGAYELQGGSGVLTLRGKGPFEATILPTEDGLKVNRRRYPAKDLVLKAREGLIQIERRRYRDQIRILRKSEKALTVVNDIDLEEYVKGVLPLEVNPEWPLESLKAQAVVSRTFALFKSIEKQGQDFAVHQTVQSQVYGGALFHKPATDEAVELTRGEILTFQGNIFPAYFHASCGGRTAQADRLWPVEPLRILNGLSCSFCRGSKHWEWSLRAPLAEIEALMQKNGFPAKNLKRIEFGERDVSGRATKVTLEYQRSNVTISANDFRAFLGPDRLKSLKTKVKIKNGTAQFHGFGWGHGIGFCQWGAKGQADGGKTYQEILGFYFPGSEIKKV